MARIQKILGLLLVMVAMVGCGSNAGEAVSDSHASSTRVERVLTAMQKANGKGVLVVAHRGDWRNAPENSIQAILNCVEMGVDMVEVDVRPTADGRFVLMHDHTVDRTTDGSGRLDSLTFEQVRKLHLRDHEGRLTEHRVPTLEEALLAAKGKILLNLDKSYDYFPQIRPILDSLEVVDHVLIKSWNKTVKEVRRDLGGSLGGVLFMPIVDLDKVERPLEVIEAFQTEMAPVAVEVLFGSDSVTALQGFGQVKARGARVWVNTMWPGMCGGHDDESAIQAPDRHFGAIVGMGVNMVQTDRPAEWLSYLRERGLHE